ncbi:MAG: hypothetical protein LBU88_08575 [Treponema sp.]|nr:hypothetical protein [Treponema sp.]
MKDFIETRIITAVRGLLSGRVNEILGKCEFLLPVIEFGEVGVNYAVSPVLSLSGCERTEKERVVRQDAFSLSITFTLPEDEKGELYCYAYSAAFDKALSEDITLGSVADRAIVINKKFVPSKKPNCGEGWALILSLRITVEEIG